MIDDSLGFLINVAMGKCSDAPDANGAGSLSFLQLLKFDFRQDIVFPELLRVDPSGSTFNILPFPVISKVSLLSFLNALL